MHIDFLPISISIVIIIIIFGYILIYDLSQVFHGFRATTLSSRGGSEIVVIANISPKSTDIHPSKSKILSRISQLKYMCRNNKNINNLLHHEIKPCLGLLPESIHNRRIFMRLYPVLCKYLRYLRRLYISQLILISQIL